MKRAAHPKLDWSRPWTYPDGRPGHQRHSDTSRDAAEKMLEDLGRLQKIVYYEIERRGKNGATDEEIMQALTMRPNTARPRRVELVKKMLVCDSAKRRAGASGRACTIWIATKFKEEINQ